MKRIYLWAVVAAVLATSACSTVDSRIQKNAGAFSSYPPDVQAKIRSKQIEVGFTTEMVTIALGEPDRRDQKIVAGSEGDPTWVWVYFDKGPHFSFGVGLGRTSGSTAVGAGVGGSTSSGYGENLRLVIRDGKVLEVEKMTHG